MEREDNELLAEVSEIIGDDLIDRLAEAAQRHKVAINLSVYPQGEGADDADDPV